MLGSRQLEEDTEPRVEEMVRIFLVDTGIVMDVSTTDLAECKVEFVERLPFQAFRCSLAEVGPFKKWDIHNGLPKDVLNMDGFTLLLKMAVSSTWRTSWALYLSTTFSLLPHRSHHPAQPSLSSCPLPATFPQTYQAWP